METKTEPRKKAQKGKNAQTPKNEKSNPVIEKATPIKKAVETIIKKLQPSADDRIRNAENFDILTTKYAHLKNKNEELKKFSISSDGSKEKLTLVNSTGFEFTVSNSQIISKAVEVFQNDLDRLLQNAEKEVQEFII